MFGEGKGIPTVSRDYTPCFLYETSWRCALNGWPGDCEITRVLLEATNRRLHLWTCPLSATPPDGSSWLLIHELACYRLHCIAFRSFWPVMHESIGLRGCEQYTRTRNNYQGISISLIMSIHSLAVSLVMDSLGMEVLGGFFLVLLWRS